VKRRPLIIVLHGPSGVGKDSVIAELKKSLGIHRATSSTTRAPRKGEKNGVDYHFLSVPEFRHKIDAGEFAEWALVYKQYKGLERREVEGPLGQGDDVIIRTDVQGARTWRTLAEGAISVFLLASDEERQSLHIQPGESLPRQQIEGIRALLKSRLTNRDTEDGEAIATRLEEIDEEVADLPNNDYVVFNVDGRLDATVARFAEIIAAEQANPDRPPARLLS
jgi:guanylate kinase